MFRFPDVSEWSNRKVAWTLLPCIAGATFMRLFFNRNPFDYSFTALQIACFRELISRYRRRELEPAWEADLTSMEWGVSTLEARFRERVAQTDTLQ